MGGFTNTSGGIKLMRETQFTYEHGDRPRVSTCVLILVSTCILILVSTSVLIWVAGAYMALFGWVYSSLLEELKFEPV